MVLGAGLLNPGRERILKMAETNVQTQREIEVGHLNILNAFHDDDINPIIDFCVNLAEKGGGKGDEEAWKYLSSLDNEKGDFGTATLAAISAGFVAGFIFGKKFKIEDEKLSGFLARVERDLKDQGALPKFSSI